MRGGTLVTQDPGRRVFPGDVLVVAGRIAAVGEVGDPPPATRLLEAGGCLVLPGFVLPGTRLARTPLRGLAADEEGYRRLEAAHDATSARWAARAGAIECLVAGVTAVGDAGVPAAPDAFGEGIEESGLRAVIHALAATRHDAAPPDPLHLMRLMHRVSSLPGRAEGETPPGPAAILDRFTVEGAREIGLDREVGSLEPSKRGDLVVLDPGFPSPMAGGLDPVEQVVTVLGRDAIRWTVVDGEVLVDRGRLLREEGQDTFRRASEAARAALARAATREED